MNALLNRDNNKIVLWLAVCALLVAAMVFVGGYTRLSGSGLSITSWKPIHGVIPPLNDTQWLDEFDAYRQSPQYIKINKGMTLPEFKSIFWPEFFHRLLGRAVGLVFFLPLILFAWRRSFTAKLGWRLVGIFALGGLQGVIGWLMVASGLIDNPHVSHLRLALHLATAFAIFGLIVWTMLDIPLGKKYFTYGSPVARRGHILWFTLLCLQIIFGALVAGLHAGLVHNTWPAMSGQWLPGDLWSHGAWFENPVLIQFIHRKLAVIVALGFIIWWYCNRVYVKSKKLGPLCAGITAILALQFMLGVLTLVKAVPLSLALLHQLTALLLFGMVVVWLHRITHRL